MKIIIYKTSTLRGVATLEGSENSIQANIDVLPVGRSHLVIPAGTVNGEPSDYRVENGEVVHSPRPSLIHVLDAEGQWIDPRTLQDLKDAKWAEIKAARNAAEFSTFTWDGSGFDSDAASQSRIQGAAQLATLALMNGQPFSIDWTLADNAVLTLSAQDMIAVGMAMGAHINAQHTKARVKRQEIEAAITAAEVEAVVWLA